MTSIKDNTIFDKTSFLEGSNSSFIEELYLKYINNPENIPQSWREFFDGLDEDQEAIKKEIFGPSWSPKKDNEIVEIAEIVKNFNIKKNFIIVQIIFEIIIYFSNQYIFKIYIIK